MARKLSFVLALAAMAAMALLLNLSSTPQIGVAGQAPGSPIDPGVISTNEDVKVDVEVGAIHDDGTTGCEELDFSTSNAVNGTVGAITDRDCNTTDLAADLRDDGFYTPGGNEDAAGLGTCSDGIDNGSDGIDAEDSDCRLDIIPVASTLGFPGTGVVQIGSELMTYGGLAAAPCGAPAADVTTPCLTGVTRAALKSTAAAHTAGDAVIFRSELSGTFSNTVAAMTADDPLKDTPLDVTSVAGFSTTAGVLLIDDELIIYEGVETTTDGDCASAAPCFGPTTQTAPRMHRGALGSTAAAHDAGALVSDTLPGSPYPVVLTDVNGPPGADTVIRVTTLVGLGDNGGIAQLGKEQITFTQTSDTETDCGSPAPTGSQGCLTGVGRGAFGTNAVFHAAGTIVFTIGGNDLDQAVINFTPANNFNDEDPFIGVLTPNIIGGGMDVNGDGVIDSKDNSNQLLGASILSGLLDCDDFGTAPGNPGSGTIDTSDDCTLTAEDGTTVITVVDGAFQLPDGPLALTFSVPDIDWNVIAGRVDSDGSGTIDAGDCTLSIVDESLPFNNNGTTKGTDLEIDILSSDGTDNPCEGLANATTANNGGVDIGTVGANGNIGPEDDCSNGCFFGHNVLNGDVVAASAGFSYVVGKGGLDSTATRVDISVAAVNDAPEFKAGAKQTTILAQGTIDSNGLKETNPNTSVVITANDVDNIDLEFTVTSIPSAGSLWANAANKITGATATVDVGDTFTVGTDPKDTVTCEANPPDIDKTPNTCSLTFLYVQDSSYDGSDSFTIEVTDGETGEPGDKNAKGLDTLAVNITNSRPTAGPIDKVEVPTDGERTILLTASDADLGHCELNFIVKTHPTHGNLVLQNNNECRPGDPNTDSATMVYRPDTGYSGPDSFTYQVFDRTGKGLYDAVLGDGHNRTSLEVEINVSPIVPPLKDLVFGDVDCDGDVDGVDALKIQRWIIGLSVTQEPGCLEIGSDY